MNKHFNFNSKKTILQATLYGTYALYCQQTKRSAKTPQNFSAELLELIQRTLGWSIDKARLTIAGKRARVIKGLRLRSTYDKDLTVEEILVQKREDEDGDNCGTTQKKIRRKKKPLTSLTSAGMERLF